MPADKPGPGGVSDAAEERIMAETNPDSWRYAIREFELGIYDRAIVFDDRGHCFPAGAEEAIETVPDKQAEEEFL